MSGIPRNVLNVSFILVPVVTISYFLYHWYNKNPKLNSAPDMPYGLFHLSLNKLPQEPPDEPPKTEWLNMGYWKDAPDFPSACRALALKVISAANVQPGASVLDVGFGTGECLVLLLSDPSVPRPSKLSGITDISLHCERTRARLTKIQGKDPQSAAIELNLVTGDAIWGENAASGETHPFHPSSPSLDAILATDCAYHFHTRRKFLTQAFAKLHPGGRIALADICFASSRLSTWRTRVITFAIRLMPLFNRIGVEGYIQQMQDVGFVAVMCEDITDDVFPHFIRFLKSRGVVWWIFACMLQLYISTGARFVIVSGEKP